MVIKSNYFQFSVIWTYFHYPKTYLPIGSNWLFFSYFYFTGRLHPVTAIHEILQFIAIFLRIFDSNRFESAKSCNILQYFKDGCNRLQPYTKYCNILQLFYRHGFESIRIHKMLQYLAIFRIWLQPVATVHEILQYIATFCWFESIRIENSQKYCNKLQ